MVTPLDRNTLKLSCDYFEQKQCCNIDISQIDVSINLLWFSSGGNWIIFGFHTINFMLVNHPMTILNHLNSFLYLFNCFPFCNRMILTIQRGGWSSYAVQLIKQRYGNKWICLYKLGSYRPDTVAWAWGKTWLPIVSRVSIFKSSFVPTLPQNFE